MKYDLHIHTTESDGKLSKLEVMRNANQNGISLIAFTDHNTCKNLDIEKLNKEYEEVYNEKSEVTVIPGVEIDVGNYGGLHIIAYGMQEMSELSDILDALNQTNEEIAAKVIDNLNKLQNVDITCDEVRSLNKEGKITKRSTIDVLMQKGYASSPDDACKRFVGKGAPSYIKRRELMYEDVLPIIDMCGGVSVLAHPGKLKTNDNRDLTEEENIDLINDMMKYGLSGIECLTPKHTKEQVDFYNQVADEFGLIPTAGHDYHNPDKGDELGYTEDPERYAMGLVNRIIELNEKELEVDNSEFIAEEAELYDEEIEILNEGIDEIDEININDEIIDNTEEAEI